MAQITSREELVAWLKGKPTDWAQVIAVRAALRLTPFVFLNTASDAWCSFVGRSHFQAISLGWTQFNLSGHDTKEGARRGALIASQKAVRASSFAFSSGANSEGFTAAVSVIYVADVDHGNAVYPADAGFQYLSEIAWRNVEFDCQLLDRESKKSTRFAISRAPLWGGGIPLNWADEWSHAATRLLTHDPTYQVWIDWYNRRIEGHGAAFDIPGDSDHTEDKKILARLADASDKDFWDKGATYVNTTLQSWIDEARERVAVPLLLYSNEPSFFISYSTKDEAIAREVDAILSELGCTSIAQFKDFPQGNFVRGMQDGIAGTDRFIALQSKAYWESDHCQSEWAAAYARDPGAKLRKIVPFLLEPVSLPPIASEIVYKSLLDLTKAQRKKAIIEWIKYEPPSRSPLQLRMTLAKQASPEVRLLDDKIDAGPNTLFDKPIVDMDLAELPSNLRALLKVLIGSLPNNTPPIVRNCLNGYNEHLLERGAQPIVGTVDPFAEAIRAQIVADAGYWDAGLESLFAAFFKRHELLITHFPLNPERELLVAETPIDEVRASGAALLAPVEAVAEAMAELKLADLTTEDFDRVEEAHKAFSRDIASLPMPKPSDDVTPKRRYVLGTIGFYERLLAALGAAAGIAATPQGQAAIAAVSSAIETFMGFIL